MTYSLNQHNGYWASVMRGDMAKGRTAQTACNDTYRAILMMGRGQQEAMRVTQEAAQTPVAESGPASNSPFLFYASNDGSIKVQVMVEDETVWASQKGMAEIFGVDVRTVSEHLQNIFSSAELDKDSVIRKFRITATGQKSHLTNFYNLDAIISVGYRVNSVQVTGVTTTPKRVAIS